MYFLIGDDGQEYGPVDADKVREWIAQSRANAQSKLRYADSGSWQPLENFVEFTGALVTHGQLPKAQPAGVLKGDHPVQPVRVGSTNPFAVVGFWFSLAGIPCCCTGVFSLAGLILSIVGLVQTTRNTNSRGKWLAIAGLIISFITLAAVLLLWGMTSLAGVFDET